MKKVIFSFILLGFAIFLSAQTVDSIKVEQAGDFIKIRYKILNSNQYQTFRVTVFCSINGGLESKLKSLSGDFGESVVGGRDEYMVLWDVLKDVDEVKSVDFSIRAELIKDISQSHADTSLTRKIHVLGIVEPQGPQFGIRIGYMGNWGVSGMVTGSGDFLNGSLDLTKRIVNKRNFKWHFYAGVGFVSGQSDNYENERLTIGLWDVGFIWNIKRVIILIGANEWFQYTGELNTRHDWIDLGIGICF